jgi:3',5'-cyclic AMP phosphodiesterase CpdA
LAAPDPALAEVASSDPVLVGAGDIASCDERGDEKTARLLDGIAGTVFTVGDNAYESGRAREYRRCYDPTWGRHKARTRPAPGNHDYRSSGGAPYYDYFGQKAGPAGRGYYSYDLGAWHVISLNSNIAAEAGSRQYEWLRKDLAANPSECAVAYWHHPVFNSGDTGNDPKMAEIWKLLDESGVDVVLAGHAHSYERFAPQDYLGNADPNGIREFVVGTGGRNLRPFSTVQANSEVCDSGTFGVLKLTLHATSYD